MAIASSSAWPNGSTRLGWQTTRAAAMCSHLAVGHGADELTPRLLETSPQRPVAEDDRVALAIPQPREGVGEPHDVLPLDQRADKEIRRRHVGARDVGEALDVDAQSTTCGLAARLGTALGLVTQVARDGDHGGRAPARKARRAG